MHIGIIRGDPENWTKRHLEDDYEKGKKRKRNISRYRGGIGGGNTNKRASIQPGGEGGTGLDLKRGGRHKLWSGIR